MSLKLSSNLLKDINMKIISIKKHLQTKTKASAKFKKRLA